MKPSSWSACSFPHISYLCFSIPICTSYLCTNWSENHWLGPGVTVLAVAVLQGRIYEPPLVVRWVYIVPNSVHSSYFLGCLSAFIFLLLTATLDHLIMGPELCNQLITLLDDVTGCSYLSGSNGSLWILWPLCCQDSLLTNYMTETPWPESATELHRPTADCGRS
jgi:hypothetical protein